MRFFSLTTHQSHIICYSHFLLESTVLEIMDPNILFVAIASFPSFARNFSRFAQKYRVLFLLHTRRRNPYFVGKYPSRWNFDHFDFLPFFIVLPKTVYRRRQLECSNRAGISLYSPGVYRSRLWSLPCQHYWHPDASFWSFRVYSLLRVPFRSISHVVFSCPFRPG